MHVFRTLVLLIVTSPSSWASELPFASSLLRVDQLPSFRQVTYVGAFSSYDRTGANDDGGSGRYSFLRKEGDGLVIAEMKGPGAITRIWTPTPTNDLMEFYFDGETKPRLAVPFIDLFSGNHPPFISPLSGHAVGGYYTYVPLEFAKSMKVVLRGAKMRYYMVNYVLYPPDVPVHPYQPGDLFAFPGLDLNGQTTAKQQVLEPGKAITLFDTNQPGRIVSLKVGPPEAVAGEDRAIVLRIYWDNVAQPAVDVPAGDFFGYSFGRPAARSLLFGSEDEWDYVRIPMPFKHAARIDLVSQRRDGPPLTIRSEVVASNRGQEAGEGTFHAKWNRENPTTDGVPFTYLDVKGRGQVVGMSLQAQGKESGQTLFFEGDDEVTIDGDKTIHGTGSEDSFNGGWYDIPGRWYEQHSLLLSGCLEYNKYLGRTGGYRVLLSDAYAFQKSVYFTIEHSGEKNNIAADYTGTTYFYLDRPEGDGKGLPDVAVRTVSQPDVLKYTFFVSAPPIAATMGASLSLIMSQANGEFGGYLSFSEGPQVPPGGFSEFGPAVVVFAVDAPVSGDYAISVEGIKGPSAGILQLRVNDQPAGNAVDFYAAERSRSGAQQLAELHFERGINKLYFTLAGRNQRSSGGSVDLVSFECKRLR